MRRDFNLIRSILLQVEAAPRGPWLQTIAYDDDSITAPDIAQHVAMMEEFGLIEAKVPSAQHGFFAIGSLTMQGYDFLEAARNETLWQHVMSQIAEKGLPCSLPIVSGLLNKEASKLAGL